MPRSFSFSCMIAGAVREVNIHALKNGRYDCEDNKPNEYYYDGAEVYRTHIDVEVNSGISEVSVVLANLSGDAVAFAVEENAAFLEGLVFISGGSLQEASAAAATYRRAAWG